MPKFSPKFLKLEEDLKKKGIFFVAGADEAGRGCLAGPVVCAMVMFKDKITIKGLNDSKQISAKKRESLYKEITEKCLDYAIAIVSPELIDKLNISGATRFGFKQCVENLKFKPEFVLMDGIDKQIFETKYQTIVKGDSRVKSIASASILAKVFRDKLMSHSYSKIYPQFFFEKHKGYGTRLHRGIIKEIGRTEIHRKSFILKDEK